MIWSSPPADKPYHSPVYDRFWRCAEELGMPLTLHVITDRKQGEGLKLSGAAAMFMNLMTPVHEIQKTLLSLIFYGVLERFPRLKLVVAENDSGWMAHFMYRIDHMFEKFGAMTDERLLSMPPSDFIRRNVWVTFQDDLTGAHDHQLFRRGQLHVGVGLSAYRHHLAQFSRSGREATSRESPSRSRARWSSTTRSSFTG